MRIKATRLSPYLAVSLLIAVGFLLFPASGRDDAFITYWAAYSLDKFGQILNYNLQHVEQSSSLAQVVIVGLFSRLFNTDIVTTGRLSTIFFGGASVFTIHYLSRKAIKGKEAIAAWLLASNPFFIYWSFGGLDTTLAALGWLLFIVFQTRYLVQNKWVLLLFSSALVLFIRPENPLIVMLFSLSVLIISIIRWLIYEQDFKFKQYFIRHLTLTFTNGVLALSVFATRYFLFQDAFPQPVYAKTAGLSKAAAEQGLLYLKNMLFNLSMAGISLTFLAGCLIFIILFLARKDDNPYLMNAAILVGIYFLFITLTGGDWMEGGRFVVPVIPFLCIFAVYALSKTKESTRLYVVALSTIFLLQTIGLIQFSSTQSTALPIWENELPKTINTSGYSWFERHNALALRDMPTISALDGVIQKTLQYKKAPVVVMSGQMGMVAYYIAQKYGSQVYWLDRNSLVDRSFTDCNVSNQWERDSFGRLRFSYKKFVESFPTLAIECKIPFPDIIFDLEPYQGPTEEYGFRTAYFQDGNINAGIGILGNSPIDPRQFIAINKKYTDLVEDVGFTQKTINLP